IAIVEPDLRKKKIKLSIHLEKGSCHILADRTRLQQVFWNVLKNAVKFTPESGTIDITTKLSPNKKNWITKVTDSGIGMTPAEIKKIFDAFAQGEHSKTGSIHKFGGLGLG